MLLIADVTYPWTEEDSEPTSLGSEFKSASCSTKAHISDRHSTILCHTNANMLLGNK